MLDCDFFHQILRDRGIGFFAGVPDSLLKYFCAYLSDHVPSNEHVIAANEGGAVGLAAGHYLATGRPAMVYLQNSGQGNAVNPLLSLCDPEVSGIPMLLLVGWRGEPGIHDEPQHIKQGRVMNALFDAMEVPFEVLSAEAACASAQVEKLMALALKGSRPVALVVQKGTFSPCDLNNFRPSFCCLSRENAIEKLAALLPPDAAVVSTTGHISRELHACRKRCGEGHGQDFMMVGSMGHASQVALGIALAQPERSVFCFDGDGATLMHMGGLALAGQSGCRNLKHIVFNNGAHGSVGGQPTVAFSVSLTDVARACGYAFAGSVSGKEEFMAGARKMIDCTGPAFLEICVASGARGDLERPDTSPAGNKREFMEFMRGD